MNSPNSPEPTRAQSDRLYLTVVVLIGLILRLDFLVPNHFVIDADEAIVGLMAKHIVEGIGLPVFYYGQHYMGSFEPLLAAVLFRLLGVSSVCLKLVPLLFSLGLISLVYSIARELGTRFEARVAALLCSVAPLSLVVWSGMARGGFIEVVFIGALALLLTIRWLKQSRLTFVRLSLMYLLLGFGWWVNNQIIYFILPISLFVGLRLLGEFQLFKLRDCSRLVVYSGTCLISFLIGGLPFWIYNLQHHFVSFKMFTASSKGDLGEHLSGLVFTAIPIILGGRRFWSDQDYFPGSAVLSGLLFGGLLLIVVMTRARHILRLCLLRIDSQKPVELLFVFVAACLCVFTLSSFGNLVQAPRYLLPLYAAIFVLAAQGVSLLMRWSALLGYLPVAGILAISLCSCYLGGRAIPGEPFVAGGERVSKDQTALIEWLEQQHYSFVRTNYWIGYRLAFETDEKVKFVHFQIPEQVRIPEYIESGSKLPEVQVPLVLVPYQAQQVAQALQVMGYSFEKNSLSGYQVFSKIQRIQTNLIPLPAEQLQVNASAHPEVARLAIDGTNETRWGSARAQSAGMQFEIVLNPPQEIRGIGYDLGKWWHDFPRLLNIKLELESGEQRVLLNSEQSLAVQYYQQKNPQITFSFEAQKVRKVIFEQLGSDPVFDWTMAEIQVLR